MGPFDGASTSGGFLGLSLWSPVTEDLELQPLVRGCALRAAGAWDPGTHTCGALFGNQLPWLVSSGPVSLAGALSPPIKQ